MDAGARAGVAIDALPGRQEAGEPALVGGLDLLAKRRQRGAAQAAKHLDVAPVTLGPAGPQLAANDRTVALELAQHGADIDAVTRPQVLCRERAVRGCKAPDR